MRTSYQQIDSTLGAYIQLTLKHASAAFRLQGNMHEQNAGVQDTPRPAYG